MDQHALVFVAALFVGILAMLELGRRVALRRHARGSVATESGLGSVDAAVFGLLGLMVAFTFSGANQRFESRRDMITEEANDIGTAYLRIDLVPAAAQPALRDKFRRYADARIATYAALPDVAAAQRELDRATALQGEIWTDAVAASAQTGTPQASTLLLPAINAMIDIATTRTTAARSHAPLVIFVLLAMLAFASACLAGYDMAGNGARNWTHIIGFAFGLSLTMYVVIDLEYPRLGFIDLKGYDRVLVEARGAMH